MNQKADAPDTTIATAAVTQAAAESTPGAAAAPAESVAAEAAKTAPENPFAAEDAELAALEAQAKAESEAAGKEPGEGDTAATAAAGEKTTIKPAKADEVADAAAAATASGSKDSTAAVIALRRKLSETHSALLIKEGENRVLKTLVDPDKFATEAGKDGHTTAELSPEEQELQAIKAERRRIGEEVDRGQMSMAEHNDILDSLSDRDRAVTLAQAEQFVRAQAQPANDLGLEEHLNVVLTANPVLSTLNKAQLNPLEQLAKEQARLEGKPIQPHPIGTRDLRERMGALATQFYGKAAATAATGDGATATGSTVQAQPTAAEREAKLVLAGNHPPNIGTTGSGATGGEPSEAQATAALAQGEDAAIRWMEANPGFVQKTMGKSMRLTR